MSVDLAWHPWTADVTEALAFHVRGLLGPGDLASGRLCPRCGSAEHGRPWARHGSRSVPVSLSRSRPHLLTAVGTAGSVGVDVESVAAVDSRWDPALVLAPGERADTPEDRGRAWARKEAVLKAYAVGLAQPMCRLVLADFPGQLRDVPAPPGYVAAVAELREAREGRSGTTTRRTAR